MGSDDARQLDIPLKCKVTAPMMHTLASLSALERSQFICWLSCRISNSKWMWKSCTQYLNHMWTSYRDFIPRSSHDPLWSHRGICLCYSTWSCPTLLHGIKCFLSNLLWSCLTPRDCENVRSQDTSHGCFQFLTYSSFKCKIGLSLSLHNGLVVLARSSFYPFTWFINP